MNVLEISNLSKSFGAQRIIDQMSFSVKEGSIFGFIGQNGAGKTTTMKMVLGLLKADQGDIKVCGEPVKYGQNNTNKHIGFLPDVPEYYNYMKPKEYLSLCGEITNMPRHEITPRVQEMLHLVGLENANKRIGSYSRGMKQRLGIAQALLNRPKLLICDEPTSALDPVGRKDILDILQKVKGDTTVIFSTHILSDVERICDEIAVLHKGKISLSGSIADLKSRHTSDGLFIEFLSEEHKKSFLRCESVISEAKEIIQQANTLTIKADDVRTLQSKVFECLVKEKIVPAKIEIIEPSIENLFLEVVK